MSKARSVEAVLVAPAGAMPNNPDLPLLLYRDVVPAKGDAAAAFEALFSANGWVVEWQAGGIYPFHHYHSTRHEAVGVARGTSRVRFGGEGGPVVEVHRGDAVIIPAGVAHKGEFASEDFLIVGAYPDVSVELDRGSGRAEDRERELRNIRNVGLPSCDPVFGRAGPLVANWRVAIRRD
jgi:uncharacterized protein YjlB